MQSRGAELVFDPSNPEYEECRLEDANWLEEVENEDLEGDAILAYAREDARELLQGAGARDGILQKLP